MADTVVSKNLHKVSNCTTTSAVAAEDKIPTMWFYLWWDFFHRPVLELRNKRPFLSSSFLTSTVKKQSTTEPSHPFWNANPPQPGKEQVNILSPSSKATTGVCPRSGITRAQAWQSSAGVNYSVSRGCKRKKRPSGGSGMPGEGDFNSLFLDARLRETFLIFQSSPFLSTREVWVFFSVLPWPVTLRTVISSHHFRSVLHVLVCPIISILEAF